MAIAGGAGAAEVAAPPAADQNQVTEVVVTAEKQTTTVQAVPIAITAIPAQVLGQKQLVQLSDLNGYVPSLTVAKSGGFVRVVSIRGIGYEASDNLSAEPGTSFHIDGVYIASPYALQQDLLDLQRLEVLRGPQGTVFGQSATGGVINAITNKPSLSGYSGMAEISGGTYNLIKGAAEVNVPLTSTLAARVTLQKFAHDGFAKETDLGNYGLDDANNYSGRVALLWQATDKFSVNLAAQNFMADQHGSAQKNVLDPDPNPRQLSQDYPNRYKLGFFLTYADVEYDLGFATFKSLTSYQRTRNHNQIDVDRLDYKNTHYYDAMPYWNNYVDAYSQEFDLTSSKNERFEYIVGGYFLYQKLRQNILEFSGTNTNPVYQVPMPLTFANYPANLTYQLDSNQERYTYAAFAQSTFHLTDKLSLVGGLRYTRDRFDSANDTLYDIFAPRVIQHAVGDATTGKFEADYQVTPRNMIYAEVSRGYKPGGVSNNSTPLLVPLTYKPEFVWAYEAGSKNRFFDNKLTLNAAGFFYDYANLQYQEEDPVPFQGGVANVPKVQIWGAEFEGAYQLTPNLKLDGNVTTLGGKMLGKYLALDPSLAHQQTLLAAAKGYGPFDFYTISQRALQVRDTNGNTPPKLPDVEGRLALTYTSDLGQLGMLRSTVEGIHRGKFEYRIFNDGPLDVVPSYDIANLFFEYTPNNAHWALSLAVTNLTDKAGVNSRYSNPFGSFTTSQEFIAPRQVIGSIRYTF